MSYASDHSRKHELSDLYEGKIKRMGNAGRNGGEYYTPRPLIRAIIQVVKPKVGERIYDGWLCVEYYKSAEFQQLAPNTQRARRLVFEGILHEPISPKSTFVFADCPVGKFAHQHVRVLRDRKRTFAEAANIRLKALRGLFNWATENGTPGVKSNPARDVPRLKVREDGYHAWTEQERARFEGRHAIGTKARLAYALLFHTGQRRSDVVRFGRQHVHAGKLRFTQQKNRNRKPITLELPLLPALQEIVAASRTGDLTFLVTEHGQPFTANGFGNKMRQWCDEAELPECTAHGLRKAGATIAAENGATAHQLMSIFGWLTLKEAERYTRAAEQKRLAAGAMSLLERKST